MQPSFRFLRILGIILLAITAVFTLLGGVGTTCVAFNAENFGESMAKLVPVKPIFQLLVVISITAALFGCYTTYCLARGKRGAYLWVLVFLIIAGVASAIQFYYSLTLRGSTAPNNIRLYTTLLTLGVFLLFRLPSIWQKIGYEDGQGNVGSMAKPSGLALFLCGLLILTLPVWGASTHMIAGVNTVNVLLTPLMIAGTALSITGLILLSGVRLARAMQNDVWRMLFRDTGHHEKNIRQKRSNF